MVRLLRWALPAGMVLALMMSGSALAATDNVSIVDFAFSPSTVKVKLGDTVHWTNNGPSTHTSTSDGIDGCCPSGPSLWASGSLPSGSSFDFVFSWAGSFPYHCTFHTFMKGTVSSPIKVSPTSGTVTTQFTITFATALPPAGYNVDVQIKRPGGSFVDFMTNITTKTKVKFTPDAGTGTYAFRARLRNLSNGASSGWSPPATISVS